MYNILLIYIIQIVGDSLKEKWNRTRVGAKERKKEEVKEFFQTYARNNRFDSLQPHQWYLHSSRLSRNPVS